jgi:hypothetical protein
MGGLLFETSRSCYVFLATGNWQLATGNWQLETGNGQRETGNGKRATGNGSSWIPPLTF